MSSLIDAILRTGRLGGICSLVIASGLFSFTLWDYSANNGFFIVLPAVGVLFSLLGVLLIWHGNPEDLSQVKERPLDPAFEDRLNNTAMPYFVCTSCRRMAEQASCERCGSSVDVLEVRDGEDLSMARSAMT